MKKLVYYLIYLLALILMVLCSSACRSPKTMAYSQATTDSVKLSMKDSTSQRFEFTFDSLEFWTTEPQISYFSTTDFTDLTDEAAIPSGRLSVRSVRSVVNKNLPCSFVSSVFNKNLPCSHIVVYGGKVNAEQSKSVSQDSTSSKKAQEVKTSRIRSGPVTPALIIFDIIFLLVLLLFLIRLRSSS